MTKQIIEITQKRPRVVDLVSRIVERDGIAREELLAKVDALQSGQMTDADPDHDKTVTEKWREIDWKVFWVRYAAAYPSTVLLAPIAVALYAYMIFELITGFWR